MRYPYHVNRNRPSSLTANTGKARLLSTQMIKTVHIGQCVLLDHCDSVVVLEPTLECLLHQWDQRVETTCVEHFSGVQCGHISITTINPLNTLLGVESLFADHIEEVIFEEAAIPLQGYSKVLALPLLLRVGRAPGHLLCLVLIVCGAVELACRGE